MTVRENLELGAFLRRDSANIDEDMERVFDLFPRLKERETQKAGTMSGGEQQMLAIGRALMSRPRVLLLDEPSLGLAPLVVEQIFRVIQEVNKQGTTVLLVEQNANMALAVGHYAYVLETGTIALQGPAAEVRGNDRVRKAYLGED
jgi:branched-chain amino acid transport system ATP-binding protein